MTEIAEGTCMAGFVVGRLLGEGAQGAVYRAIQQLSGRQMALKVLHLGTGAAPDAAARFEREIEALHRLHHPHIVECLGGGQFGGLRFLAMEYLPDLLTLSEAWTARDATDVAWLLQRFDELLAALGHLQKHGFVTIELLRHLGAGQGDAESYARLARALRGVPRTIEAVVGTLRQKRTWTLQRFLDDPTALQRVTENPARELYQGLTEGEKLVVQTLSIFEHPIPHGAVQFVLNEPAAAYWLDDLVRNLVVDYTDGMFSLHPLDMEYSRRQIPDEPGPYGRKARHAAAPA